MKKYFWWVVLSLLLIIAGLGWYIYSLNEKINQEISTNSTAQTPTPSPSPSPTTTLKITTLSKETERDDDISDLYIESDEEIPFTIHWPESLKDMPPHLKSLQPRLEEPIANDSDPSLTSDKSTWIIEFPKFPSGEYTLTFTPTKTGRFGVLFQVGDAYMKWYRLDAYYDFQKDIPKTFTMILDIEDAESTIITEH